MTKYSGDIEHLSSSINTLPNLTEIRLHSHQLNTAVIKEVAKCEMLTLLHFGSRRVSVPPNPFGNDDFEELLDLVSKRKSMKKLIIRMFVPKKDFLRVTQDKINASRELLEIQSCS